MSTFPAPLSNPAQSLRSNQLDLLTTINEICGRLDAFDPQIQAFLPEPNRRTRLMKEADALKARFPDPTKRPPLYGVLVGVEDIAMITQRHRKVIAAEMAEVHAQRSWPKY